MPIYGEGQNTNLPQIAQTEQSTSGSIAGGSGFIGGIISAVTQPFMQKWQQDFERHEAGQAWERNIKNWEMQNEYNSPAQQMQRLKEAGLNPNLVYGKGAVGNSASQPAPYQKAKSISRELRPVNMSGPLDVLAKYHGVRKLNEEANASEMTNRANKSSAYVTWLDTYDRLKRLKAQTRSAEAKAKLDEALAFTQQQIAGWAGEGFTAQDPLGARRVISRYSGDAKSKDYLLNAISGAKTVSGMLPKFGLGFLSKNKPKLK